LLLPSLANLAATATAVAVAAFLLPSLANLAVTATVVAVAAGLGLLGVWPAASRELYRF
jgi:hypothetical protein